MNSLKELPPLEYLRSFVTFVESKNIVLAAQELAVSQPLISKHLTALETHLGMTLFDFVGRKKQLTPLGEEVYQCVKNHLIQLQNEMRQTMMTHAVRKNIRIAGRKELLDQLFETLNFTQTTTLLPLSSTEILNSLEKHEIDIGLTYREVDTNDFIRKKVFSDELILCWNTQCGIKKSSIPSMLEKLMPFPCLDYGPSSSLSSLLKTHQIPRLEKHITYPDWRLIMNGVRTQKCWAVIPSRYVKTSDRVETIALDPDHQQRTQFYIYYSKKLIKLEWFMSYVQKIIALYSL